ncbi:MAG: putative quorum-sensing-regulated virulence factor [Chthoniobacteraceae bacterium]|nr:putative quorum-sensing-regulated virulence factor [Chthoniobacteraceae bacterium]
MLPYDLAAHMAADLADIERTRMPFGKFGPANYPPYGVPLYDLPAEYLGWFVKKGGFPKGRLGELLRMVHQMKVDGSDFAFDEMRRRAGGRTVLFPPKRSAPRSFK